MSCVPKHILEELGVSRRKEGREIMDKKLSKVCWFPSLWLYSGWMPIASKSNLSWAISPWKEGTNKCHWLPRERFICNS